MSKIKAKVKRIAKVKRVVADCRKIMDSMKIRGDYGKAIAWMRSKRRYTRNELIAFLRTLGKSEKACSASATVLLSPRESSTRKGTTADSCCGNKSNPVGHLMFNDKLKRKVVEGVKEEQTFCFKFRKEALERRTRYTKVSIKAEKVETKVKAKAPAKTSTSTSTKAKSKKKITAKAK